MGTIDDLKPVIYKNKEDIPYSHVQFVDLFENSVKELFVNIHPKYKNAVSFPEEEFNKFLSTKIPTKVWIYYPAQRKAISSLQERDYTIIRTARNRNVITAREQLNYRKIKIGIIGLSIGSIALSSLVATGGPRTIKIADNDVIEITNLNRMWATLLDVGELKVRTAARNTWELDPFANIYACKDKITLETIQDFITSRPSINILIDAMDSLPVKIKARSICKDLGIPVIMASSNADGVILDVERYDLDRDLEPFHGRLGSIKPEDFRYMDYNEWLDKALRMVDKSLLNERVVESIAELNKTVAGIPQLSTTVQLGAAATAYAVRMIANNKPLASKRYILELERIMK